MYAWKIVWDEEYRNPSILRGQPGYLTMEKGREAVVITKEQKLGDAESLFMAECPPHTDRNILSITYLGFVEVAQL